MQYKGHTLDKFQEDAIRAIESNHSVVVSAPTGSGKTLIADYIINKFHKEGFRVIYTAPIKALSNQKFKEFTADYGAENVGLLTGDVVINPKAPVLIMTTEIYRNMAITDDEGVKTVCYVVLDEIHFINDIERGYVWEESIIFSKDHVRFLCLSATIPNAKEFADWIGSIKNHKVVTVTHVHRPVPLHINFYDSELGITTLEDIKEVIDIPDYKYVQGRSAHRRPKARPVSHIELIKEIKDNIPCFFFNFSRQACQDFALELCRSRVFEANPKITAIIRQKLEYVSSDIKNLSSTKALREALSYGIAFHHAGLIPIMKALVEDLFAEGLIYVLYTTETFAVGINMPAKTVCFRSLRKFDGVNFRSLHSKEFFQIAGRAGRRGIDTEGFVYAMVERRDFDYRQLKKMIGVDVEPITSQFRLSVNTVLNLIKNHTDEEIDRILEMSFYTYQKAPKMRIKHEFENIKKRLDRLGYIKDGVLTEKGDFGSKIYSDEILTAELFATDFYQELNEYQLMMVVASLIYEPRERTEFHRRFPSRFLTDLRKDIHKHEHLHAERKFAHLEDLTSMVHPCYHGRNIFDIMQNVSYLEGDLIRFFRQMMDRFSQICDATTDLRLKEMSESCKRLIINTLADVDKI